MATPHPRDAVAAPTPSLCPLPAQWRGEGGSFYFLNFMNFSFGAFEMSTGTSMSGFIA